MSKNRPSGIRSPKRRSVVDRFAEEHWRERVFRNTYTYKGRRFEVARWSVKIQFGGVRKTYSLESADRDAAAREALTLYRKLTAENSDELDPAVTPMSDERDGVDPEAKDRSLPAYWKPRLIRRKYVNRLPGRGEGEWSVLIEHKSERGYFPLGTEEEGAAARAAAERYYLISSQGWKQARLNYFREITVGIVWSANPFACTYATILAVPANEPGHDQVNSGASPRAQKVVVIEPDPGIRRGVIHWLNRQEQIEVSALGCEPQDAVKTIKAHPGCLALLNIGISGPSGEHSVASLSAACPGNDIFGYGVFEDSDHIFASLSGVTGGYMLRRRPPGQLLEPILGLVPRNRSDQSAKQVSRRYFERLFDFADGGQSQPEAGLLTSREYEILSCLSKGFQDKEIADRLSISVWTVHSHLRKIFVKYGVHSRTEAVVKYLRL